MSNIVKKDSWWRAGGLLPFIEVSEEYKVELSEEERNRIGLYLSNTLTGASTAIVAICNGEKCNFCDKCPFIRIDRDRIKKGEEAGAVPIGKLCPVEQQLLNEWSMIFIQEYEIEEGSLTDLHMVRELAEVELLLWRTNNSIAKAENITLTQENIVGISEDGEAYTRTEISVHMQVKEKLQRRKDKLVKLMVGDRQEKYKRAAALKIQSDNDASKQQALLTAQIKKIAAQQKTLEEKLLQEKEKLIELQEEAMEEPPAEDRPLTFDDFLPGK